ncbi:MAG: hypothetical protein OEM62_03660, partial [Acidobacteriota bacterium]|nr:hypothetical protein [Acidobacteriota bacterium]
MDQLTLNWGPPVDIRIGNGPLATERMLLEDIEALLEELGETVLKRPLLVVVPSRSLRLHVIERLLSTRKRALAGVECRTHRSLAAMILEATGMPTRYEPDRVALFARRFSRQETALATALDHLAEGYKPVVSAVSDLLDAGLDSAHREALEDTLEEDGSHVATKADIARARAIVGVATRTVVAMKNVELDRASTLLAKATEIVRFRSPRPVSAVCVYGYSDATGVATDFLEGLLKTYGGRLYLDQPPDPAYPDRMDVGVRFSRRFSERFGHRTQSRVSIPSAPSSVEMFKALGADAEVLEVATRIRALLDGGRTAERIGVVARSLTPYRDSLRTQLARLGVPFSGVGSKGPSAPPAYRVRALLDLLRLAGRTPIERWLEARSPSSLAAADFDVRLALHTLGAGRIEEAALLSIPRAAPHGSVRLPFVNGLALTEPREDDVERKPYARRRRLEARTLERETELARAVIRLLDGGREPLAADRRLEQLEALLTLELGWAADEPVVDELLLRARQAVEGLPSDFLLDLDEWIEFLETAWDEVGKTDLGGSGGGVQVLDVTEARGRTFDQLFIIGLNRGTFPRTVHEDAMLPDSLRRVLARSGHGVLPDLPLKLDGVSEERLLFAQLLAASPSVTLSWQEVDDEHTFKTPSPLVERLRSSSARHDRSSSWKTPPTAQSPFSVGRPEKDGRPRSAYENAVLTSIFGDR